MKKLVGFILALLMVVPLACFFVPFWVFLDWMDADEYAWDGSVTQDILSKWWASLLFRNF